jgi:hypothetical protein
MLRLARCVALVALVAVVAGCGPSAELEDLRRRTDDAAARFDEQLSAEAERVALAHEAVEEAAALEARAQQRLDEVLNDADATPEDQRPVSRSTAEAVRRVEEAVSHADLVRSLRDAALNAELAGWRELYERCVALEDDESETGGCGPTPPDR